MIVMYIAFLVIIYSLVVTMLWRCPTDLELWGEEMS